MLISQSIPNLVNGVSQQPFTLRLASQAELQENGLSTTSQGLRKRPPTKHLAKILSGSYTDAFIHTINRDETERYITVITNGDMRIFDLEGNEKLISFPNGKGYLSATSPASSFRAVTVADYTFIVNNTVTVATGTATAATRPFEALVNVKAGNYGKKYVIYLNGNNVAEYQTPNGGAASDAPSIATDNIAQQLINDLNANTGLAAAGFSFVQYGSVIYITCTSNFTIRCEDGFNNGAMLVIKDQVQKFGDLPANAGVNNFAVEVVGDKNTGFDDFWVRFDSTGSGAWKETIKPGTRLGLDRATMPYTLIRLADGTFVFKQAEWTNRISGTVDSNQEPSFVGRKLTDVFFYRNRLGVLADESVIFSEASEFFNFYRTTVTELLDSDPIDVTVSHTKVSTLHHAIPFNRQLLIFSAQSQFVLEAGDLLTPKSIAIKTSTEFQSNISVKPVGIGKNVYFATNKGEYTGLREYYPVDEVSGVNDSIDVTGHVPAYIPGGAFKLAPCLTEDMLVLLSKQEQNAVWVYKFFFSNNEKLQSSWSKWTFGSSDIILNADFILSDMVMVIQRSDGLYLEKLSAAVEDIGANEPYTVHLDRKKTIDKAVLTFDGSNTNIPASALPGALDGTWEAIVAINQTEKAGTRLIITPTPSGARVPGNLAGSNLIIGRRYNFRYQFSPITLKQQAGNAVKSDTVGRLQLRTMQINFADSGYFKVGVTPTGRNPYTYIYSGKTLGTVNTVLGRIDLDTGNTKFPILAQNTNVAIEISNDSPLPCSFLSADWEGMYVKRSRGM